MILYKATLPMPPSANKTRRFTGKKGGVMNPKYRQWKKQVGLTLKRPPQLLTGKLHLVLKVYLCRGDLDNRVKPVQDIMNKIVYADDKQIVSSTQARIQTPAKEERVEVIIYPAEGADAHVALDDIRSIYNALSAHVQGLLEEAGISPKNQHKYHLAMAEGLRQIEEKSDVIRRAL